MTRTRFVKGGLIGLGALILSTVGIFASDALQGIDSRIGNLANLQKSGLCPSGMTPWNGGNGTLCVDLYEATPGDACPNMNPKNALESEKNAGTKGCYAASKSEVQPWTYVTLAQAQRMCAESGKRLPTSDEWYRIALGTDEKTCVVDVQAPRETGTNECISSVGAHDMVGNVWEWVDETVNGSQYRDRSLPNEGYVTEADASGIAIATDPGTGSELYGHDYFWAKSEGVFGMLRGGFYGSDADAGLYAVNASVPTNFATQGVGFRCVMSL
jgi:formylglycine-generating enzyme required for sulfatase activity